jgi:hypothetical protein
VSNKIAISSNEPVVGIIVPVRLLPQLVAILAAAADAGSKPCVETTGEPSGPGIVNVRPNVIPLRKVGT